MANITINIVRDECTTGTATTDFTTAFQAWGVNAFKRFMKLARVSDAETGTAAAAEIVAILFYWLTNFYTVSAPVAFNSSPIAFIAVKNDDFREIKRLFKTVVCITDIFADDVEKAHKFLEIASPEKFTKFIDWKKQLIYNIENHIEEEKTMKTNAIWYLTEEAAADVIAWSSYTPEEIENETPEETETVTEETEPENVTETAAEATETPAEPETAEAETTAEEKKAEPTRKHYRAEQLHAIFNTDPAHVKYTFHTVRGYVGDQSYFYTAHGACFTVGAFYRIPADYKKSRAADIVFRVDRNTGKTVNITVWEKYNGKITESGYKNKKLNPGSHYTNLHFDPETGKPVNYFKISDEERLALVDFLYWECIDLTKVSRWTNGYVSCVRAEPMTAEEFEAFKATNPAPAPAAVKPAATPAVLDFTPVYYPVSERLAKLHKEMISFDDYKPGSVTAEYRAEVETVYNMAVASPDQEKALYIANLFSKRLARWYDDMNRNGASCPSVMIAGPAKFPVRKKERQNARHDTLMKEYTKIMAMKDKIRHPHGYEIRRDTIADEFEGISYFEVVVNTAENRLQLIFPDKPAEEIRAALKSNGFRWSGRFRAWQRQLTENAIAAAWKVVDLLDSLENAEAEATAHEIEAAKAEAAKAA